MSSSLLSPAQPAYVLRGHSTQVHALHFTQENRRLLSGDADGWLVSWNLAFKRPVASWKGHGKAILGLGSWGSDRIISHGRDNKLVVWQLGAVDEVALDKALPVDATTVPSKQPWILHVLTVNTLNFCAFATCCEEIPETKPQRTMIKEHNVHQPLLIAVPNAVDSGGIDIYQLPTESRAAVIHADRNITSGMIMALNILAETTRVQVAAGYESGHIMVFVQTDPGPFQKLYCAQPHSQPVLSMALSPCRDYYITSSADAIIAKHPFTFGKGVRNTELKPLKIAQTKHSGQQGLRIRSDGKIFCTAGWDARVRVYSSKSMKELAVLRWHNTGCYATDFAQIVSGKGVNVIEPGLDEKAPDGKAPGNLAMVTQASATTSVQQKRNEKAHTTHWLAAGSKDGKISLWDIY